MITLALLTAIILAFALLWQESVRHKADYNQLMKICSDLAADASEYRAQLAALQRHVDQNVTQLDVQRRLHQTTLSELAIDVQLLAKAHRARKPPRKPKGKTA